MNNFTKIIATAALLGSASHLALAQQATTDSDAETGVESAAPASEQGQPMDEQGLSPVTVEDIAAFDEGRAIDIIALDDLEDEEDLSSDEGGLGEITDSEAEDFEAIVEAIEANDIIFSVLEADGYAGEDIIALGMDENGALTIYVDEGGE